MDTTQNQSDLSLKHCFKEWWVVVDALGKGEQIIILRKGGISEGKGGFQIQHPRFFLFPTLFHQQRESVLPHAQIRYDELLKKPLLENFIHLQYFAVIVHAEPLDSIEKAELLAGQHIWRPEVVRERFVWGKKKEISALAVRVYVLPEPALIPMRPEYGGCKSWIELAETVSVKDARPVLSQHDFENKVQGFYSALGQGSGIS